MHITISRSFSVSFTLILLLLAGCSRDVPVSTVLEETGGLRVGDKVYLDFASDLIHHLSSPLPYRRPEGMSVEKF